MRKRPLTLDDVLAKKLKDEEFKKCYEEELKNLHLGLEIAKRRHECGLTQKELAKRSYTSQSAISRVEKADYLGLKMKTLEKIALVMGYMLELKLRKLPKNRKRVLVSP